VKERVKIETILPGDIIDGYVVNKVDIWPHSDRVDLVFGGGKFVLHGRYGELLSVIRKNEESLKGGK